MKVLMGKPIGKPQENEGLNGKPIGKPQENEGLNGKTIGIPQENHRKMEVYPLVNVYKAIEKWPQIIIKDIYAVPWYHACITGWLINKTCSKTPNR